MTTYYERNREKCIEQATLYQWAHREHYKEYQREYFLRNKDKLQEKARLRRQQNKPPKERKVRRGPIPQPKEPKEPKKRGRPPKNPQDKKPRTPRPKKVALTREDVVLEAPEPPAEPEIIWVSDRDFICSFD